MSNVDNLTIPLMIGVTKKLVLISPRYHSPLVLLLLIGMFKNVEHTGKMSNLVEFKDKEGNEWAKP